MYLSLGKLSGGHQAVVMCLAAGYFMLNFVNVVIGEPPVGLSPRCLSLFSATANKVQIRDLRKFHGIGKFSGGEEPAVMCLTTVIFVSILSSNVLILFFEILFFPLTLR